VALEVMRHHRLLEAYLADALEMPWDRVHDEAEVLEHYISEDLERRIAEKLGNPALDPHGDPIPTPELDLAADRTTGLAELEQGQAATFARVSDSDPEMLRYLAELGIRPGARLRVTGVQPFGGPLFVEVEGREHVVGGELAQKMRVQVLEAAS
jgi:DtxR family Mn-dependent transcriptional regulator